MLENAYSFSHHPYNFGGKNANGRLITSTARALPAHPTPQRPTASPIIFFTGGSPHHEPFQMKSKRSMVRMGKAVPAGAAKTVTPTTYRISEELASANQRKHQTHGRVSLVPPLPCSSCPLYSRIRHPSPVSWAWARRCAMPFAPREAWLRGADPRQSFLTRLMTDSTSPTSSPATVRAGWAGIEAPGTACLQIT